MVDRAKEFIKEEHLEFVNFNKYGLDELEILDEFRSDYYSCFLRSILFIISYVSLIHSKKFR